AAHQLCESRLEHAPDDLGQQADLPPAATERATYRFHYQMSSPLDASFHSSVYAPASPFPLSGARSNTSAERLAAVASALAAAVSRVRASASRRWTCSAKAVWRWRGGAKIATPFTSPWLMLD